MGRWPTLVLLLTIASTSCGSRKSREWSLTPSVPTSLTLATPGYPGNYVRVDMMLPERYERDRGGTPFDVTWRTPERRRFEGNSPLLTVSLVGEQVYPNGCAPQQGGGTDVLEARQAREDLFVARCGAASSGSVGSINAFLSLQLPISHKQWYIWCNIIFYQEYELRDVDDAAAICSSMKWHVLENATPKAPSSEPASRPGP
jgi:hypothetical protein